MEGGAEEIYKTPKKELMGQTIYTRKV